MKEKTYTEAMQYRKLDDGRHVTLLPGEHVERGVTYCDVLLDGRVTRVRKSRIAEVRHAKQIGGKRWAIWGKHESRGTDYADRAGMLPTSALPNGANEAKA